MHRLFVDDMIHAATSNELRDQFIREYRADFDITLEDVMSSFLGMEIIAQQGQYRHSPAYIHPRDSCRVQGNCHKVPQA